MTANAGSGGEAPRHIPVLLPEVLAVLEPAPGRLVVDGTFGAGGYTGALLEAGADVVAFDRDPDAIAAGRKLEKEAAGRLRLVQAPFSRLAEHVSAVDGVVFDLGVSSMQLDEAERGFSFRADGPLDMRMAREGTGAADVVNTSSRGDLARIFGLLGEERHAGRIAAMIERRRKVRPFTTTLDLAGEVEALVGRKPGDRIHPATRIFQALRIFVNDELGELAAALEAAERVLKPEGRLAVVSFHSLEDRIAKRFIAERSSAPAGSRHLPPAHAQAPTFRKLGEATPSAAEVEANPRARSARLRAAARTQAPARPSGAGFSGLPRLSSFGRR